MAIRLQLLMGVYSYICFSPKFSFSKYDSLIIGKGTSFPTGFTGISVFTAVGLTMILTSKVVLYPCFHLHSGHLAIPFPDAQQQ